TVVARMARGAASCLIASPPRPTAKPSKLRCATAIQHGARITTTTTTRAQAPTPPVHTDIVRGLLHAAGARTVLDAGCGPASMLRDLAEPGLERWSFDLTPAEGFDAVICFGVLPHLPAWADAQVLANLRAAVRPGGISSSFNEWGG